MVVCSTFTQANRHDGWMAAPPTGAGCSRLWVLSGLPFSPRTSRAVLGPGSVTQRCNDIERKTTGRRPLKRLGSTKQLVITGFCAAAVRVRIRARKSDVDERQLAAGMGPRQVDKLRHPSKVCIYVLYSTNPTCLTSLCTAVRNGCQKGPEFATRGTLMSCNHGQLLSSTQVSVSRNSRTVRIQIPPSGSARLSVAAGRVLCIEVKLPLIRSRER